MLVPATDTDTKRELIEALMLTDDGSGNGNGNDVSLKDYGNSSISSASRVFVDEKFELLESYKLNLRRANFESVNFANSAESVAKINSWAANATRGKILDMLSEDAVDANTKLVLANAIYFKGRDGHRGGGGDTPIVNFELTPHHKNFKWFTLGGTPKKFKIGMTKL